MGLYPLDCGICKKPFMWFSGSMDTRCPDCIVKAGVQPEEPKGPSYRVVEILPERPREAEVEFHNVFHFALATKMKAQYGLDHLTVEEVQKKWEQHSEDWCAGWMMETKQGIEEVFNVRLEEI